MSDYRTISFRDELLPDRSVRRTYSDGRYEWRRRLPDGRVEWQDSQGASGVDEQLGDRIVKRTTSAGEVTYGRDQGYGRTAWASPAGRLLTVNESSPGGRAGAALAGLGGAALLGAIVWPPELIGPDEEEQLRQAARNNDPASGSAGGADAGSGWDGDDGDGDGDFG